LYLYLGWLFLQIFLVCTADCMVPWNLGATLLGVVALALARSRADRVAGCDARFTDPGNQAVSTQPAATSEPASSQPGDE
jgi:hypothetical protein